MSKYGENLGPRDALTPKNATILLINRQVGFVQLIRDLTPEEF
jgi:hypothetical protein